MPRFSEDDFVDFCVVEALTVKGANERQEAAKKRKIEEWKEGAQDMLPSPSGKSRI